MTENQEKNPKDMSPQERGTFYDAMMSQKNSLDEGRLETLKNIGSIVAMNLLRGENNPYGKMGKEAGIGNYQSFMTSDLANKIRNDAYNSKKDEYRKMGIPDEPVITNDQIVYNATSSVTDIFTEMDTNKLEKIVSEAAPGRNFTKESFSKEKEKLDKKAKDYFAKNGEEYKYTPEEQELLKRADSVESFYKMKEEFEKKEKGYFVKTGELYKPTKEEIKIFSEYRSKLLNVYGNALALNMINKSAVQMDNSMMNDFYKQFEKKESSDGNTK